MPGFPPHYTRADAEREQAEIENALFDGFSLTGRPGNNQQRGCFREAAARMGIAYSDLRRRHGVPGEPASVYRKWGMMVSWSMFRERPKPAPPEAKTITENITPPEPPADPVEVRRYKDEAIRLRKMLAEAQRRLAHAEDLRGGVLGLHGLPPVPVRFESRDPSAPSRETIVLMLSDLHWGEKVDLAAMDGLNCYSVEIARKRLARWTHAVVDLATKHWPGDPPDRIILILGGDLISGGIHLELLKTDELAALPAVKDCAGCLAHAITTIKANVDCPIDIISLPGNHGRSTMKPESKGVSETSYDMLASDFLELALRGKDGITFYAPPSPDALFSVYNWRILATHGDKIGSRGGQGFIGPAATAARGFKRIIADYAARGVHLDLIVIGHFHTRLLLEEGFVNGSLPGPTEYSRDGRFRPHPAMQLFFSVHPKRHVTQVRWIQVGHPEEGSLYEPPPDDRPLRPRYRVKAVSVPT